VARVRGTSLIDAQAFVRDKYGPEAVARVRKGLPAKTRPVFQHAIREVGWYPLESLTAYLVTARTLLDPDAHEFYRAQGYYAARRQKAGALKSMVSTLELRMRLVRTIWRMFYDVGRVEVVGATEDNVVARIVGFPTTAELCERFRGIWEGMSSTEDRQATAQETKCVLRGDPYCELKLTYSSK
jgi:hypothetical protein